MKMIPSNDEIFREISKDFLNQSTSDDGAGFNQFNFLANGGAVVATNEVEINNQNGRILFQSDFFSGFDTLNKFHLVYDDVIVLPGHVNSETDGSTFGSVGPANNQLQYLPCNVDFNGVPDEYQWVFQSQHVLKIGENETAYLFFSGRFNNGGLNGPFEISIKAKQDLVTTFTFLQSEWNIDTLDGSGSAGNPSGITFIQNSILNFVIKKTYNNIGDVKFGFFIGNKIVFVHEIKISNTVTNQLGFCNKPLRVEGALDGADVNIKIGLFNFLTGYYLNIKQPQNAGPSNYNCRIQNISCFAVGSNRNDYYRTFSDGNGINVNEVTTRRPILAVRLKQHFPPAFPPSVSVVRNLAIMSLKEIKVSAPSVDLNNGVFVEVLFNQGPTLLSAAAFFSVDENSAVEIAKTPTGIAAGGTPIYRKTIYPNQGSLDLTIKSDDLLGNFINQYSFSDILNPDPPGLPKRITPEIIIVATSVTGNPVDVSAEFVWIERP